MYFRTFVLCIMETYFKIGSINNSMFMKMKPYFNEYVKKQQNPDLLHKYYIETVMLYFASEFVCPCQHWVTYSFYKNKNV